MRGFHFDLAKQLRDEFNESVLTSWCVIRLSAFLWFTLFYSIWHIPLTSRLCDTDNVDLLIFRVTKCFLNLYGTLIFQGYKMFPRTHLPQRCILTTVISRQMHQKVSYSMLAEILWSNINLIQCIKRLSYSMLAENFTLQYVQRLLQTRLLYALPLDSEYNPRCLLGNWIHLIYISEVTLVINMIFCITINLHFAIAY